MAIESKSNRVLDYARRLAERVESWADFSNELYAPGGKIDAAFSTEIERQAFYDSEQCKEIDSLLAAVMRRTGVVNGATPSKSGKFVVRIPKTVHQKLEIEARREGVSLNQLAACKLSIPLWSDQGLKEELVVDAFNAVHDGYATDWIILEPDYNARFLEKCSKLGLSQSAWVLNHTLMNIRKTSKFSKRLNRATKRSGGFTDYDDFAFASEISVRTLQRTEGVTLDRILCDPELRSQFDRIALQLAPRQTIVKLRCGALNLRKTHRLQPIDPATDDYALIAAGPLTRVSLASIAASPGAYAFYDATRPIFAGETENLRKRVAKHLESGLPKWLGADRGEELVLKTVELPKCNREKRLNWLGAFINAERPLLNYQKAA